MKHNFVSTTKQKIAKIFAFSDQGGSTLIDTSSVVPTVRAQAPTTTEYGRLLVDWHTTDKPEGDAHPRVLIGAILILVLVVLLAVWQSSILMAITFVLVGVVGYLFIMRDATPVHAAIYEQGVLVNQDFYDAEELSSFWIYPDGPMEGTLSLATTRALLPYLHIDLGTQIDPSELRSILRPLLPETEAPTRLVDIIERILYI